MHTYIDLFAGCGGLTDGFEKTRKFKGLAHVEWDEPSSLTLLNRLKTKWRISDAEKRVLRFDIQRIDELFQGWDDTDFGTSSGLNSLLPPNKKVDVLIGGPPCQAYSLAGRIRDKHGMQFDYRNYLFESYISVMRRIKPDVFVFENVPGILSAAPGGVPIVSRIRDAFSKAGYETLENFSDAKFNLDDYGVPQRRVRIIIVGLRRQCFGGAKLARETLRDFYHRFRSDDSLVEPVTARAALKGLPKFYPKSRTAKPDDRLSHIGGTSSVTNHTPRFHSKRDIAIFQLLARDLMSGANKYGSIDSLKKLYSERTGKTSAVHKYHVISPNEPSNTIPAHLYKDGLRHIHWDALQARSITVREAARLQTFADDFEFLGGMGSQFKMIGNAVPPLFSFKLAGHISKLLQKNK